MTEPFNAGDIDNLFDTDPWRIYRNGSNLYQIQYQLT